MRMKHKITFIVCSVSIVIWKWSLIYFLVLLFLEDLKHSLVSAHFLPHWFLLPLGISGVILLACASDDDIVVRPTVIGKRERIFALICSLVAGVLVWLRFKNPVMGAVMVCLVVPVVYYASVYLARRS